MPNNSSHQRSISDSPRRRRRPCLSGTAFLAREAFAAASDPNRFPAQLAFVNPWRPTRLVWNTSPFFFSNRNLPFDPAGLTILEAGGYNPLLGKAYTEIAAAS